MGTFWTIAAIVTALAAGGLIGAGAVLSAAAIKIAECFTGPWR